MDLKNGYKVIYDVAKDGERNFYASKTGLFADAEALLEGIKIGDYKLIYEKNGMAYGSTTGIPAEGDHCFTEFNKVFVEGETTEAVAAAEEVIEDTPAVEDDGTDEEPDAGTDEDTGEEEPIE